MKSLCSFVAVALIASFSSCQTHPDVPTHPVIPADTVRIFKKTLVEHATGPSHEVEYNEANQPVRYTQRYNRTAYDTSRAIHQLIYQGKQLTRVNNLTTGWHVRYYYQNKHISRTEHFQQDDKWLSTNEYHYYPNGQLQRVYQTTDIGAGSQKPLESRHTFTYDAAGNLLLWVEASKETPTSDYRDLWGWGYANYDQHKNVANLWSVFPVLLPGVTFQLNNPGSVTRYGLNLDGTERLIQHTEYRYEYTLRGYPLSHVAITRDGSTKTLYRYEE